jgi:type VI secretion system VasD/TssJ family lipoprotein
MKRHLTILIALAVAATSCCMRSSKPEWQYQKNAIELHMSGDPLLNLYQQKSHSLILCVYHLKDLNGFNQLADQKGGLSALLECSRFDPSVTYSKRLVLQPKQKLEESMDRTEGAKYVGIIAGYYDLRKESSSRSFPIPLSLMNNPKKLRINLTLGTNEMQEVKD